MKFTNITIKNYRQYKGENSINLNSSSKKPVNLIVGENGSGKSNFFKAINWCLYGPETTSKLSPINHSLLNDYNVGEKINMSVKLEFEDNNAKAIIFTKEESCIKIKDMTSLDKAEAKIDNTNFKVEYWDDGYQVKSTQLEYDSFVNRLLPQDLSKFFFIDGDDLLTLMKTMKKNEVKKHFNALTKINDAEQVMRNLKNWKSKILENNLSRKKSSDITLYKKIKNQAYSDMNTLKQKKVDITLELKEKKPQRDALQEQVNLIEEGQRYQNEIDMMNRELALLNDKLDTIIEKRRQDVISSFPTFLMLNPLNSFIKLVKEKRKNHELPPPLIKDTEVIERLLDENFLKLDNTKYADIKWTKGFGKEKFIKEIEKYNKEIKEKIDSNFIDRATDGSSIASTLTNLDRESFIVSIQDSIKDSISSEKEIKEKTEKRDLLNEKLKGSMPKDKKALYAKWERLCDDIIKREAKTLKYDGMIEKATKDLAVSTRNISNMETYAKVGIANEKKIKFIEKAIETLETSISLLSATTVNQLNKTFNEVLKKTDLKNDFKKAQIYQDFSMEVKNTANYNLLDPAEGGSNGQKLNIGFAYMYALTVGTDMNFPILIDSPYGKLGQKYRKMISENISTIFQDVQATFLFHGEEYSQVVIDSFKGKTSNNVCISVTENDDLGFVNSKFGDSNDFEKDVEIIKNVSWGKND